MNKPKTPMIPISWGELIDKVTILEIKSDKINVQSSLINIQKELNYLNKIILNENIENNIFELKILLKKVNLKLWTIEDDIRNKEFKGEFDNDFIQLARSVYKLNDKRAKLKMLISQILNSEFVEEKSYNKMI
jgi:Family of unknown function (DUF6165)